MGWLTGVADTVGSALERTQPGYNRQRNLAALGRYNQDVENRLQEARQRLGLLSENEPADPVARAAYRALLSGEEPVVPMSEAPAQPVAAAPAPTPAAPVVAPAPAVAAAPAAPALPVIRVQPLPPDLSCKVADDCAVKNVGNCCGYFPACVNKDSAVDPDAVRAECERTGTSSVCGFQDIQACDCAQGQCRAVSGKALEVDR